MPLVVPPSVIFPAVIVVPSGALDRTGIGKAVALRGDRHGGGVDRPSHFLGGLRTVCPLILPPWG